MKTYILIGVGVLVLAAAGAGIYFFMQNTQENPDTNQDQSVGTPNNLTPTDSEDPGDTMESDQNEKETVIGSSVSGKKITAYNYGTGDTGILFVGGIHGGYEWNTVLAAYELMDYLEENPGAVPSNIKVTVIPVLNPDGLEETVGSAGRFKISDVPTGSNATVSGRFNANVVDLNRNFDCDWQAQGTWQTTSVSGGSKAFSEPESQAFRDFVQAEEPTAVVVWYSSAPGGGVFASNCHDGVLPETTLITDVYARASGYKAYKEFNYYEITGDAVNWLAKNKIPAISVLLSNHQDTEWSKNKAGIEALLDHYAK
jgi:hypothetical protein